MPVNQKDSKKNAPQSKRDSALVPRKESAGKQKTARAGNATIQNRPATSLSTVGKKKTPKQ